MSSPIAMHDSQLNMIRQIQFCANLAADVAGDFEQAVAKENIPTETEYAKTELQVRVHFQAANPTLTRSR